VFVGIIAAIYQFQGRGLQWPVLLAPPVVVTIFVWAFIDNFSARVSFVGLVIGLQAVWALAAALERHHATVGRGKWLLVAGLGVEAGVLGSRALLALSSSAEAATILQGSLLQTLTFMGTFSVVLVSSMGFVFMTRDRADESNRILAAIDPLTGVANRRSLVAALDRDVSRAVRTGEPIALMMVDVDHFKRVNDRHGHQAGDRVLCRVVDVLRRRVRAQDLVGRYGGEEFMVVLPDTSLQGAEQLAHELCREVAESRCRVGAADDAEAGGGAGINIAVTVSIGVFGGGLKAGDSWDMVIAAADRALYQAKRNGRDRVEVSTALRRPAAHQAAPNHPETHPASNY
jgi:diguanylate cyclase (GGDEF)-like protein